MIEPLTLSIHESSYVEEVTHFVSKTYAASGRMEFDDYRKFCTYMEKEDKRLAKASTIVTGRDSKGKLLSTARAIIRTDSDANQLPIEQVFGYRFLLPDTCRLMEISRLASVAGGGFSLTQNMLTALCVHCAPDPTKDVIVACLDNALYERLCDIGWPVRCFGDSLFYMGSETVPVRVDIRAFQSIIRAGGK